MPNAAQRCPKQLNRQASPLCAPSCNGLARLSRPCSLQSGKVELSRFSDTEGAVRKKRLPSVTTFKNIIPDFRQKPWICFSVADALSRRWPLNLASLPTRYAPGGIALLATYAAQGRRSAAARPQRSVRCQCPRRDPPPSTRSRLPAPPTRDLKKSSEHTLPPPMGADVFKIKRAKQGRQQEHKFPIRISHDKHCVMLCFKKFVHPLGLEFCNCHPHSPSAAHFFKRRFRIRIISTTSPRTAPQRTRFPLPCGFRNLIPQ
ncbi:MAG: hypothetical protein JWL59_5184 [Chthoniobacteraceae bacterium]|nr:hypothetical protein [Chthoniobacteraceae bacterium]